MPTPVVPGWNLPVPGRDPAAVRAAAGRILAGHQFAAPGRSILGAIWHWLITQLSKLGGASPRGGGSQLLGIAVAAALGVALVALLWMAMRGRGTRRRRGSREVALISTLDAGQSAEQWRARAAAHEGAGEWREGLRCRYRALVVELADGGALEDVPGRTSGELRAELAERHPAAAAPFSAASEVFERCWYGSAPAGPAQADQLEVAAVGALAALRAERVGATIGAPGAAAADGTLR
ncbi:MAG: DUF4129 domain-containing protein [Acidimicrobiales bacterium]